MASYAIFSREDFHTFHRLDGPVITGLNGSEEWYAYGKRHRLDGPAIIHANGDQEWYLNGKRHRLDGAAIIYADGSEEWWIADHNITHLSAHQKLLHIQHYHNTADGKSSE